MRKQHPAQSHLSIIVLNKSQIDFNYEIDSKTFGLNKITHNDNKHGAFNMSMSPGSESSSMSLDMDWKPNLIKLPNNDGFMNEFVGNLNDTACSKTDLDTSAQDSMPIDLSKKHLDKKDQNDLRNVGLQNIYIYIVSLYIFIIM